MFYGHCLYQQPEMYTVFLIIIKVWIDAIIFDIRVWWMKNKDLILWGMLGMFLFFFSVSLQQSWWIPVLGQEKITCFLNFTVNDQVSNFLIFNKVLLWVIKRDHKKYFYDLECFQLREQNQCQKKRKERWIEKEWVWHKTRWSTNHARESRPEIQQKAYLCGFLSQLTMVSGSV